MIQALDWRPFERATLRGFCTLELEPSGIVLRDCTLHETGDRTWVGLPRKPVINAEGHVEKDPASGKTRYQPVVEITGKENRERFQRAAVAAVRALIERRAP
jgi:hypothetical protein